MYCAVRCVKNIYNFKAVSDASLCGEEGLPLVAEVLLCQRCRGGTFAMTLRPCFGVDFQDPLQLHLLSRAGLWQTPIEK